MLSMFSSMKLKKGRYGAFSAAFLAVLCAPFFANAIQISPLVLNFDLPNGGTQVLTVFNEQNTPVPVEIVANKRNFAPDGTETRTPTDDFIVFPPQTVIEPNKVQRFRLQYVGDPELAESNLYAITAIPVAVNLKKDNTELALTVSFNALAHVNPRGAETKLAIVDQKPVTNSDGKAAVEFQVRNDGNRYAYLAREGLVVSEKSGDRSVTLKRALTAMLSNTLVLPNTERTFVLQIPEELSGASDASVALLDEE